MKRATTTADIFGQTRRGGVFSAPLMMSSSVRLPALAVCAVVLPFMAAAQTNYYTPNGTEYAVVGSLPGDQVFPDAAISTTGGFLVWQDNITDGAGWGISARRLDSTLSGTLGTFRVNVIGAGSQENPRVAMLKNGGAAFVWQGGRPSFQHIYARFLTPTNTFSTTNDIKVNAFTNYFQVSPAVAVLNNSNVVVVWGSFNEAGPKSLQDVYGQIFSPAGQQVGRQFLVNQSTNFNQRDATVAALPGGGFVVGWVSEANAAPLTGTNSVSGTSFSAVNPSVAVYARQFSSTGVAVGGEYQVNTDLSPCASPAVAVAADGSYLFTWTAQDTVTRDNSLDVCGRIFSSGGVGGAVFLLNTHIYGDQYMSQVRSLGLDFLVTWTSLGQDGSREGVYGRFVHSDGTFAGGEFLVNTTTMGQQMQPALASDGVSQFLVVWTSFSGFPNAFDLYAQRYANGAAVLATMSAPYVWVPFVTSNNIYQPRLAVSWTPLQGLSVSNYEVYVDGSTTPMATLVTNQWTMTAANGLTTNSTHSFQVDYVVADGRRSPVSDSTSGTTWGGKNWGGIPYEWMIDNFGPHTNFWWSSTTAVSSGGPTIYTVFLSGGDPSDSTTWLQTQLNNTPQGLYLNWNTQSGATYQVQATTDFTSWSNVGSPRFAAGTTDSINVGGSPVGYYRVVLLR